MKFQTGDRVCLSNAYCKSTFADHATANHEGTVQCVKQTKTVELVKILWDGEGEIRGSLAKNIQLARSAR